MKTKMIPSHPVSSSSSICSAARPRTFRAAILLAGLLTAATAFGLDAPVESASNSTPISVESGGFTLNIRNAPLDLVLEDLVDAAGFIVQIDSPPRGSISVIGKNLNADEIVQLLDSELDRIGYAASRNGRVIRITEKSEAFHRNPVKTLTDPDAVPDNDEVATYIIPIHYVEARQLLVDLSMFLSSDARAVPNEAGNAIVITDTQSNIKHLVAIIKAIDSGAESAMIVRPIQLHHADATEMANLVSNLFPDENANTAQAPMRFNGGPFNPAAAGFAGAGNSGNTGPDRIRSQQVHAVADARTSTVIVTATMSLIDQVEHLVRSLDEPSTKDIGMQVFKLDHADAQEILPVLQQIFPSSVNGASSATTSSQNSLLAARLQGFVSGMSSSSSSSGNLLGGSGSIGAGGATGAGR